MPYASRAALALAVVAVALIGTDVAVARNRSAGTPSSTPIAAPTAVPTVNANPGIADTPTSVPAPATNEAAVRGLHGDRAAALFAKAVANALSQGSVHTVAHNASKKYGASVFDNYDTTTSGRQHFTIYGGNVWVRVIGSTTYFTGDERGLRRFFGFTADEIVVLHHRWLMLRPGQSGYEPTTAGITLPSILREDRIVGPLRLLPDQLRNGTSVTGVQGRPAGHDFGEHARATMWISTGDDPLPVEFVVTGHERKSDQTFSDWGKPVRVVPPAHIYGSSPRPHNAAP